jgi:hypothetical protein
MAYQSGPILNVPVDRPQMIGVYRPGALPGRTKDTFPKELFAMKKPTAMEMGVLRLSRSPKIKLREAEVSHVARAKAENAGKWVEGSQTGMLDSSP